MCKEPCEDFGLSIEKREGILEFDLSDHMSGERVERDPNLWDSSIET